MYIHEFENFKIITNHEILSNESESNIDFCLEVNGQTFWGSAFSIDNVRFLMDKDKKTGESCSGNFFWSQNAIIVREMTLECISKVLEFLIKENLHCEILYEIKQQ